MKREQKVFAMLMAACMAFAGISTATVASAAAPVTLQQFELGNYLPDEQSQTKSEKEITLPSGKKVIKASSKKANHKAKKTARSVKKLKRKTTKRGLSASVRA